MSRAASDTLEKVSGEFEGEVLADLESGKTEALAKVASAMREAKQAVAKILETGAKQAESVRRQVVGAAELETRNAQLRSLEKAVNETFELAAKQISGASGSSQEKAVSRLIEEGIEVIGPRAKVQCSSKDRIAVSSAIKKLGSKAKIALDDEPIETMGGVILTTQDGSVRFDNTFEARLERMKPTLRREIAAVLTGAA